MNPITKLLAQDETLLWSGRPEHHDFISKEDALVLLLAMGGLAFAAKLCLMMPLHAPGMVSWDWYLTFWGFPSALTAISLYCILKMLIINRYLRNHYYYIITDKRIVVIANFLITRHRELTFQDLGGIEISEHGNSGQISFYKKSIMPLKNGISVRYTGNGPITFWEINNAADVYSVIQRIRLRQANSDLVHAKKKVKELTPKWVA